MGNQGEGMNRRHFIGTAGCRGGRSAVARHVAGTGKGAALQDLAGAVVDQPAAEKGTMQHLDFAKIAKSVGIDAIEYVNQFFMDKATDAAYLAEMNARAKGEGVTQVLIMCDNEGRLGDPDAAKRQQAVENHYKWVTAAKTLGCHSIRVNAYSEGTPEEQAKSWPTACTSSVSLPTRMAST